MVNTERNTDSDDIDAVIGDDFLLLGMVVEVLEFALLGEVMNAPTALANRWEGAEVLDHLLSRRAPSADEHDDNGTRQNAKPYTTSPSFPPFSRHTTTTASTRLTEIYIPTCSSHPTSRGRHVPYTNTARGRGTYLSRPHRGLIHQTSLVGLDLTSNVHLVILPLNISALKSEVINKNDEQSNNIDHTTKTVLLNKCLSPTFMTAGVASPGKTQYGRDRL